MQCGPARLRAALAGHAAACLCKRCMPAHAASTHAATPAAACCAPYTPPSLHLSVHCTVHVPILYSSTSPNVLEISIAGCHQQLLNYCCGGAVAASLCLRSCSSCTARSQLSVLNTSWPMLADSSLDSCTATTMQAKGQSSHSGHSVRVCICSCNGDTCKVDKHQSLQRTGITSCQQTRRSLNSATGCPFLVPKK